MAGRIDELRALREGLASADPGAPDAAKRVAQALRGSGGTFGFPQLTAVAALVESAPPSDTYRRVEGLIEYLNRLRHPAGSTPAVHAEWLARSAGLSGSDTYPDLSAAWEGVATKSGLSARGLAERAARSLGLGVADLSKPSRAALRLVPETLIRSALALPTGEDGQTITVASADPTLLTAELELLRLTGRRPVFMVASPEDLAQFVALLEIPSEPSPARRKVVPASEGGSQRSVLLVDDDPGARLFARRVLEKSGYPVVDASNGREALERLEGDESVALVVADLNMPELDGLELIWEMRDVDRWSHIPVIVLTGETDELLEAKLIEEGADDYLSKPFDPRMFVARVGATMRRAEEAEVHQP